MKERGCEAKRRGARRLKKEGGEIVVKLNCKMTSKKQKENKK